MKISWNPQEFSYTARTKNSSRTNKQLRFALGQKWNLFRHGSAREVFCCCIFGETLRQKWTSILTGLSRSCVVYLAQVDRTTEWRVRNGKVCTFVTIWGLHCTFSLFLSHVDCHIKLGHVCSKIFLTTVK